MHFVLETEISQWEWFYKILHNSLTALLWFGHCVFGFSLYFIAFGLSYEFLYLSSSWYLLPSVEGTCARVQSWILFDGSKRPYFSDMTMLSWIKHLKSCQSWGPDRHTPQHQKWRFTITCLNCPLESEKVMPHSCWLGLTNTVLLGLT